MLFVFVLGWQFFLFIIIFYWWFFHTIASLSHHFKLLVFPLESKSLLVSKTLLYIQNHLNNTVVIIVSILSEISNYFGFFSESLENVPSAPTSVGVTDTFIFHSFFISLAISYYKQYLSKALHTDGGWHNKNATFSLTSPKPAEQAKY